jgi:hypothetical protein
MFTSILNKAISSKDVFMHPDTGTAPIGTRKIDQYEFMFCLCKLLRFIKISFPSAIRKKKTVEKNK